MSNANKKQRHAAKRKDKRLAKRRREGISPAKRLAEAPGELECWSSQDIESNRQLQFFVYKRGAGLRGMAAFLVDRGVVGLKDAWVRMHLDYAEFEDALEACRQKGVPMHRVGPEEIRRWVAGGLRWAHENGMCLPKDWAKAASFIGGVGDWHAADVSAFAKEFAGHPDDLRQRLISEPLDSYLQRDDIEFIFDTDAPYMDQKTGIYSDAGDPDPDLEDLSEEELEAMTDELPAEEINELAGRLAPAAQALADQSTSWLQAQGETPSSELTEAWNAVLLAQLLSKVAMPEAEEEQLADFGFELLRDLSARIDIPRADEYQHAVGQVLEHLQTNPAMMSEAILQHPMRHA